MSTDRTSEPTHQVAKVAGPGAAAQAKILLFRRRNAVTWPARRYVDTANQAPISHDDIERWLDEEGADLRRKATARSTRRVSYLSEATRARLWGYGAVLAGILSVVVVGLLSERG